MSAQDDDAYRMECRLADDIWTALQPLVAKYSKYMVTCALVSTIYAIYDEGDNWYDTPLPPLNAKR